MSAHVVPPFSGHPGRVSCVAYSPGGRSLAVAGSGGAVSVWDARSGALRLRLIGHMYSVAAVVFSPDGSRLATAGRGGTGGHRSSARTAPAWPATAGTIFAWGSTAGSGCGTRPPAPSC